MIGFINHYLMLGGLIFYTWKVYIRDDIYEYVETDDPDIIGGLERVKKQSHEDEKGNPLSLIILVGIIYTGIYFFVQIHKIGLKTFVT